MTFELLSSISSFLDPQLVFILLQTLQDRTTDENEKEGIHAAMKKIISSTQRFEDIKKITGQDTSEMEDAYNASKSELEEKCKRTLERIEKKESQLRRDQHSDSSSINFSHDSLSNLFEYAKLLFNGGEFQDARDLFDKCVIASNIKSSHYLPSLWGRSACDIILEKKILHSLKDLQSKIDNPNGGLNYKKQIYQRSWLLHWLLFGMTEKGVMNYFMDLLKSERYRQVIQNTSPWLLRYYFIAYVMFGEDDVRELPKLIAIEEYQYSDAITKFANAIFQDYDFYTARNLLKTELREELNQDPFLKIEFVDEFIDRANQLLNEQFVNVHTRITFRYMKEEMEIQKPDQWLNRYAKKYRLKVNMDENGATIERKVSTLSQTAFDKIRALVENK